MNDNDSDAATNGSDIDIDEQRNPYGHQEEISLYSGTKISKILTENDIVRYLKGRFEAAENLTIFWPPLMLKVLHHLGVQAHLTEHLIGTTEMLLDVPIQIDLTFGEQVLDLNDKDTIIFFDGRLFIEAVDLVKRLLKENFLALSDIRLSARKCFL
jgi:hypothetical protein